MGVWVEPGLSMLKENTHSLIFCIPAEMSLTFFHLAASGVQKITGIDGEQGAWVTRVGFQILELSFP